MSKNIVGVIVALVVVGGGAFYGGMQYGKSQAAPAGFQMRTFNGSGQGNNVRFRGAGGVGGINMTNGSVLSISGNTLTLQLGGDTGGSKIVLISSTTPFMHTVQAPVSELKVGDRITVVGQADSSGAITAQSIQVRPASSTFMMNGGQQPSRQQ